MESDLMEMDANAVKLRAEKALALAANDDFRDIFKEEIMSWTDYYTENVKDLTIADQQKIILSIGRLWIEYANMEKSLKQFKKASQVFDDAMKDTISCKSVEVYISCADFYRERGKASNEQKVFVKGLQANLSIEASDILWSTFLNTMHTVNKSIDLTIQQLFDAVKLQLVEGVDLLSAPSETLLSMPNPTSPQFLHTDILKQQCQSLSSTSSAAKEGDSHEVIHKTGLTAKQTSRSEIAAGSLSQDQSSGPTAPAVVGATVQSITQQQSVAGDEAGLLLLHMTPELLIRLHSRRPPMLFCAPGKNPALDSLSAEQLTQIDMYLGTPIKQLRDKPLANNRADHILDMLEAMWCTQALKERHFDHWFSELQRAHRAEEAEIRSKSTSSRMDNGALAGHKLDKRCAVKREVLGALVNRSLALLLLEQQRALVQIGFPGFDQGTVDKLSALFRPPGTGIFGAVSDVPGRDKGVLDDVTLATLQRQQLIVCAVLAVRLRYYEEINPGSLASLPQSQQPQPQQHGKRPVADTGNRLSSHSQEDDINSKKRRMPALVQLGRSVADPVTVKEESVAAPGAARTGALGLYQQLATMLDNVKK